MPIDELKEARLEKLKKLRVNGMDPYPSRSSRTHTIKQIIDGFEEFSTNNDHQIIVGRIMAKREHGGSTFADITDGSGSMQVYFKKDELGDDMYDLFNHAIDIGDFIETKGSLFVTKKEEKTLKVTEWKILSKSLLPLPEKWHGLQDVEERYRKRYLDLIMDSEVREKFRKRAFIYKIIRDILYDHEFTEVVTPTLQKIYGGASARPFKTHINAYDMDLFLRIAPELYLKRLLIGGYERVFEFTTNFRNEGVDREHNPEFAAVEWYAAYKDYEWNMELCEEIFSTLADKIAGGEKVAYGENTIDFSRPFKRMAFYDLMKEKINIDINDSFENLKIAARKSGLDYEKLATKEIIIDELFKKEIRSNLIQPVFLTGYNASMFPLAKKNPETGLAEVFQFYAGGMELVKSFTELNDPIEQKERLADQENRRAKGDAEAQQMDHDYIEAMEYGMPPNSGAGLGLDRVAALFTNSNSIREIILFPFMKQKK